MASDIILYEGKCSFKETEEGGFVVVPKAFLTEGFAGVRVEQKDIEGSIDSEDTGDRSLLAAIRGTLLAQELPCIVRDDLYSCFCICNNSDYYKDKVESKIDSAQKLIGASKLRDIRNFIPQNFEQMMITLIKNKFPFDGDEIITEIKEGRLKKYSTMDDILNENTKLSHMIDEYEYGIEYDLNEFKCMLNKDFYEFAHIYRPFSDEFFAQFDKTNFKSLSYGGVNHSGLFVMSKLKGVQDTDFNFIVSFANELIGNIKNLRDMSMVYAYILFKKTDEHSNFMLYTPQILEEIHGKQKKFTPLQKLPFMYQPVNAMISLCMDGAEVTASEGYDLMDKVNLIGDNVQKRWDFVKNYHLPSDN